MLVLINDSLIATVYKICCLRFKILGLDFVNGPSFWVYNVWFKVFCSMFGGQGSWSRVWLCSLRGLDSLFGVCFSEIRELGEVRGLLLKDQGFTAHGCPEFGEFFSNDGALVQKAWANFTIPCTKWQAQLNILVRVISSYFRSRSPLPHKKPPMPVFFWFLGVISSRSPWFEWRFVSESFRWAVAAKMHLSLLFGPRMSWRSVPKSGPANDEVSQFRSWGQVYSVWRLHFRIQG